MISLCVCVCVCVCVCIRPTEIAVLIDSLFLSLVMGSTVTLNVSTASFPLYYQRESVATKQVRTPYSLSLSLPLHSLVSRASS